MKEKTIHMNYIDLILVLPFIWAVYRGLTKGLIYEVATLAALILGIYGAYKFSWLTTSILVNNFNATGQYLPWISFAITFIIIVVVIHLIARTLTSLVNAVALGFINRSLGVVFALIKTAFIISILLVILAPIDKDHKYVSEENKEKSVFYYPLYNFAPSIFPFLHLENIKAKFDKLLDDLPATK
ncbi:CvpA family protein [Bacteroidota bacterium]